MEAEELSWMSGNEKVAILQSDLGGCQMNDAGIVKLAGSRHGQDEGTKCWKKRTEGVSWSDGNEKVNTHHRNLGLYQMNGVGDVVRARSHIRVRQSRSCSLQDRGRERGYDGYCSGISGL
jgi:hypothetical protein